MLKTNSNFSTLYSNYGGNFLAVVTSILLYGYVAYFFDRSDFALLLCIYSLLFLLLVYLVKFSSLNTKQLTWLAVGFRCLFLCSLPMLSQDFYRFIWDGRMWASGISPYLLTPNEVMQQSPDLIDQGKELVNGMQDLNASHYSNYPPVSQWVYVLSAKVAPTSILGAVLVMRIVLIMADVGILFFGKKILTLLNLPSKNVFWFILNPLIILELTGNLHFEGLMLFFLLGAMYFLLKNKCMLAAVGFGLSVATKLLPLVLLPLFFHFFHSKGHEDKHFSTENIFRFSGFAFVSLVVFGVSFVGLANENFLANFLQSIGLWFGTFEFNASVYYVLRWIGYQWVGWNTIATLGKILPVLIVLVIGGLTFLKKTPTSADVFTVLLIGASVYLLLSTTVHPWYLATPLLLSVFTRFHYMLLWSFLVMLSYAAYQEEVYHENLWLVAVEYVLVVSYLVYEFFFLTKKKDFPLK